MPNPDTQLAVQNKFALARQMDDNTFSAIKEIYDGASDEKVALVIDYCKARKLDPLKKPVHIVPVWSNRRKQMVETLWPSVSEVRITAMRTGLFAGQSATEFGPDVHRKIGNVEMTFPEWAMCTVFRTCNGAAQPFPGPKCRWTETYANRGKDDASPNSMWMKRPYAQLEKCAEAAALRRAFPEEGNYTAEEMHGKAIDEEDPIEVVSTEPQSPPPVQRADPKPRKGASAAKEAAKEVEVVVEQPKTTPEPAKPVEAAPEPKNVTPEPTPEPKLANPIRVSLNDGEKIVANCEVCSIQALNAMVDGKPVPSVKVVVKGDYNGMVQHKGGGKADDKGQAIAAAPWAEGNKVVIKLHGKLSTAKTGPLVGQVIAWVESVEAEPEAF